MDDAVVGCPTPDEFRRRISDQVHYDPFGAEADLDLAVKVYRSATGLEADLVWKRKDSSVAGERRLSSADDCAELARGMSFAVAVQIQLLSGASAGATPKQPKSAPVSPQVPKAKVLPTRGPLDHSLHPSLAIGAGPSAAVGTAPALSTGGRAFVRLALPRVDVELAAEKLVDHGAGYSIICSDFGRFEHLTQGDAGGYFLQRLARKLAREQKPALLKRVEFDSEASMFCALGDDPTALVELAALLRGVCTGSDDQATQLASVVIPPLAEVEALLLAGFVKGADAKAQAEFLRRVPTPTLTLEQTKRLADLASKDAATRLAPAQRIDSDARNGVFHWGHYLSHPISTGALMTALDAEHDEKPRRKLLKALAWTCTRHLPDWRSACHFGDAMADKHKTNRWLAVMACANIVAPPWPLVLDLATKDRATNVRVEALRVMRANLASIEIDRWENFARCAQVKGPHAQWVPVLLAGLSDAKPEVRTDSALALLAGRLEIAAVRKALASEKDRNFRECVGPELQKYDSLKARAGPARGRSQK